MLQDNHTRLTLTLTPGLTLGLTLGSFGLGEKTPSENEIRRWARRTPWKLDAYEKRTKRDVALLWLSLGKRPRATAKRYVRITRRSVGTLDRDNLIAGCKCLVDSLTLCGAIKDDSERWVEVEYVQAPAARMGMLVEVFELAGGSDVG